MALLGRSYTKPIIIRGADGATPAPDSIQSPVIVTAPSPPVGGRATIVSSPAQVVYSAPYVVSGSTLYTQPRASNVITRVPVTDSTPNVDLLVKPITVFTSTGPVRHTIIVYRSFLGDEEEPPGPVTSPHLCHPLIVYGTLRSSDVIGTTRESNVIGSTRVTDVVYSTRASDVVGSTRLSDVIGTVRATDVIGTVRTTTTEEYC